MLLIHCTLCTVGVVVAEERPAGVTVVAGNQGGASDPEKRRSKKTLRVVVLMFWMVFWIRPPMMVSVLMADPVFTIPPLPPDLIVAMLASIRRLRLLWALAS